LQVHPLPLEQGGAAGDRGLPIRHSRRKKLYLKKPYTPLADTRPAEINQEFSMRRTIRFEVTLAAVVFLACAVSFAQSPGEAIYKQKCLNCHGVNGLANSGVGKIMKVKPVTDPDVRKMNEAEMIAAVRNGAGKMEAYKDSLTESQIKASVDYFRSFLK
jgi:mono/diheme cytochrome c family protein